jgi:type VI secretion system protein VasJ
MLGLKKSGYGWQWTICGKHPVAGDYFQSGSDAPLLMAFSDWIEKGYRLLKDIHKESGRLVSWRFWAQGIRKDIIVCGVVKDSSDRIGRPYPILLTGTGILKDWKNHWDLLPFAFEKVWTQMDYLCSKRYKNFNHLEKDRHTISAPEPLWSEYVQHQKECCASLNVEDVVSRDIEDIRKQIFELVQQSSLKAFIGQDLSENTLPPFGLWHSLMKESLKNIPNAVFMGEIGKFTYLTIFMHALIPDDFVRLWSD